MENSVANVSRSLVMAGSLEDAVTTDEHSHVFNGAKRHHAAAPERNLLENGDFHRAHGLSIPQWVPNFSPTLAENTLDFVTGIRSYDIAQKPNANDGLTTTFTVPETTDYITVMVRYKNVASASAAVQRRFGSPYGPLRRSGRAVDAGVARRYHHCGGRPIGGFRHSARRPDRGPVGGRRAEIRVDEAWAVVGATAAPPRAHAHRIEVLPAPVTVASRKALKADAEFPPTQLIGLPGLGQRASGCDRCRPCAARHGDPAGRWRLWTQSTMATLPRVIKPFIKEPAKRPKWTLDISICDRFGVMDRQVVLRAPALIDGIGSAPAAMATSYQVEVVA